VTPVEPDTAPWERATRDRVEACARSILERCAPRTAASALIGLKCVIQRMEPESDWRWLKDITNRLDSWAQPSVDRRAEILSPAELFHGALREQERFAALQPFTRTDETVFRDVLIFALLVSCPIRMRNLVQIEIGVHLRRVGDGWELHFADPETKTRQPLRYIIASALGPWIDVYLEKIRPGFRIEPGCQRLWPGGKARPLAYETLYARVIQTTERLFGTAITPHSFRSIAATALAEASPEDALHARPLLGHRLPATTERYYVKATQLKASRRVNAPLASHPDRRAQLIQIVALHQKDLAVRRIKLEGLYDAVAGGLRTAGLAARLEALEEEITALEATLAASSPGVRPVPANIDELYHTKVRDLATSLRPADPRGGPRTPARTHGQGGGDGRRRRAERDGVRPAPGHDPDDPSRRRASHDPNAEERPAEPSGAALSSSR
jgi:integrase